MRPYTERCRQAGRSGAMTGIYLAGKRNARLLGMVVAFSFVCLFVFEVVPMGTKVVMWEGSETFFSQKGYCYSS